MTTPPSSSSLVEKVAKALLHVDQERYRNQKSPLSAIANDGQVLYRQRALAAVRVVVSECVGVLMKSADEYNACGEWKTRNVIALRASELQALLPSEPEA